MWTFLTSLFSTSGFPPRWSCGPAWRQEPWVGYLHIFSDIATFFAYYAVPVVVIYFVVRQRRVRMPRVFYVFLGLIFLSCGTVHLVEAGIFYWPMYRLSGVLKLLTAVVSCAGVVVLVRILPRALELKTGEDYRRQVSGRREAEASLELERNLLHTLINQLPDAIYFKDREGRYLRISQSLATKFGLAGAALAEGRMEREFLAPEHAEKIGKAEQQILSTGKTIVGAVEEESWPDGTQTWVSTTRGPLRDQNGDVIGTFGVSRDITRIIEAEEQLRSNEERFQLCVRGSNDGIWDWDVQTNHVYYASRFKELLGYQDHEMDDVLEAWRARLHPDDVEPTMEFVQAHLERREPYDVEYRLRTKSGEYKWFRARGQALWDESGKPTRMAGSITEITKRKAAEAQVRVVADKLALPGEGELSQRPIRLSRFTLRDMISCGADIRRMSGSCDTEHQLAAEVVNYLRRRLTDDQGRPALALTRLFRTTPFGELDPGLQSFAAKMVSGVELSRDTHCLTLLSSSGDQPQWNEVSQSKGHRAIPLLSVEAVEGMPMISQLIQQLGLDLSNVIGGEGQGQVVLSDVGTGVFHVPEAAGSPFIPAQQEFVEAHGIQSVVGFGDVLPSGRMFAVICFSKAPISHEAAVLFSHLSISTRLAMLAFGETDSRVESQIVTVDRLIGNYEEVVCTQEAKLDATMRDLREARDAAEAGSRAKSDFLANMSHEIRTPMNGIIGMAELLSNTDLSTEQKDYLGLVKHSADSLLHLLNDILDFSKIEAGKLELESIPFSLRDTVGKTAQALGVRAAEKGLELNCRIAPGLPDRLLGDPGRLRQVLVNLVGNAVKFTESGEVLIDVSESSRADSEVGLQVSIKDTGIGIPREKIGGIFDAFSQADESTTRKYGGTGLGLAICSQLVAMMKGQIWVDSELARGTTFHFTVAMPVAADDGDEDSSSHQELDGMNVLVVDDNATNRRVLEEILASWRLKAVAVADGPSALEELERAVETEPYQVVLLDCMMPEMDGFEVAQGIRNSEALRNAKLIMISSAARPGDSHRCRELGIVRYMTKPVVQSELLEVMLAVAGRVPPAARMDAASAGSQLPPMKVLLVEDGAVNQQVATGLLQLNGHQVAVASNGRQAVEAYLGQPFDVVLMDVQMPEMDGLEATTIIREHERQHGVEPTPIIAMTAAAMKGDRERCLDAGMDAYVAKPIDAEELFKVMASLLVGASLQGADDEPQVFDADAARARVGGDEQALKQIASLLLVECEELMSDIRAAIERSDADAASRAAHTLRGSADVFSAQAVIDGARALEEALLDDNAAATKPLVDALASDVNQLTEAVRNWLEAAS